LEIVLYDLPAGGTLRFTWGDESPPELVPVAAADPTVVAHTYRWSTTYTIDVDCWEADGTFFGSGRAVVVIPWDTTPPPPRASWGDAVATWGDPAWGWSGAEMAA